MNPLIISKHHDKISVSNQEVWLIKNSSIYIMIYMYSHIIICVTYAIESIYNNLILNCHRGH